MEPEAKARDESQGTRASEESGPNNPREEEDDEVKEEACKLAWTSDEDSIHLASSVEMKPRQTKRGRYLAPIVWE